LDVSEPVKSRTRAELAALLGASRPTGIAALRRPAILWPLAIVVAGVAIWWFAASDSAAPDRSFISEPVIRGDLQVLVTATGSVQPVNKVDVSSELSGTIRRVLVDYNSKVTAGQTLAELDTDKLSATLDSARAKLAAAKAQLVEADATVEEKRRDYDRKRTLSDRQVASAQDLDAAKASYDRAVAARASAAASIGVAEADMHLAQLNLSKTCICSPIDGVVLKRSVDPGQTVAATLQAPVLFSIAEDLAKMEIQVDVDEADIGTVREGQNATFRVDAYADRKFDARLRLVRFASETVQGVVTYKAILDVDNKDELLRPGMTATAEIVVERVQDAVLVPNAALRFVPPSQAPAPAETSLLSRLMPTRMPFQASKPQNETGARAVWQLRDGVPVSIGIETGVSDGKYTMVRSGDLAPGASVIVDTAAAKR